MSIDRFSNYIPIVSTITNVKKLIDNAKIKDNRINEVSALLKSTQPQEVSQNLGDIKARKLSKGEILYSVIATFPFLGNLAVAIYDLGKHLSNRSNKSPVDNSRLEVEHLEVDNQKEKAREEINGKLIQLKAHFPEIQIIINELVNEKFVQRQ